jgi:transcriptional regulator with XRE-family HTH domain
VEAEELLVGDERILVRINAISIRRIIIRKNLLHRDVARKLRTTPRYWSQMLTNHRRPSSVMRLRIQGIFKGYAWDALFKIDGDADTNRIQL